MVNSLNSVLSIGILSARSFVNNIKKKDTIKEAVQDNSKVNFKSLFIQIQAMAELDNLNPIGRNLNIII